MSDADADAEVDGGIAQFARVSGMEHAQLGDSIFPPHADKAKAKWELEAKADEDGAQPDSKGAAALEGAVRKLDSKTAIPAELLY